MKTYKKIVEKNRLEIYHDENFESPREWGGNLGYFITSDRRMDSPDKNEYMERIVRQTGKEAQNQKEHIKMIKKAFEEELSEGKVLAIYPITKYEHSGVVYKLGNLSGFDYSNNGFYIITEFSQKKNGTKKSLWKKEINQELEVFNQWVSGEVYAYNLYDKNGEETESVSNFYDIEDMREYLPEEWKNEDLEKYVID